MHPQLAARRLDVLHSQLEDRKACLLSCLDTIERHMHQLYLISGDTTCLTVLPVTKRLREQMMAVDGNSLGMVQEMQELGGHLTRIASLLAQQID